MIHETREEAKRCIAMLEESKNRQIELLRSNVAELRNTLQSTEGMKACLQAEVEAKSASIRNQESHIQSLEARLKECNDALTKALGVVHQQQQQRALAALQQHVGASGPNSGCCVAHSGRGVAPPSISPPPRCPRDPISVVTENTDDGGGEAATVPSPPPTGGTASTPIATAPYRLPVPPAYVFVISGFRTPDRVQLERTIERLGGVMEAPLAPDQPLPSRVTHVVAGSITAKVVGAMLTAGVMVVSRDYVGRSAAAGDWLPATTGNGCIKGDPFRFSRTLLVPAREDAGTQEVCHLLKKLGFVLVVEGSAHASFAETAGRAADDEHSTSRTTLRQFLEDVQPFFLKAAPAIRASEL